MNKKKQTTSNLFMYISQSINNANFIKCCHFFFNSYVYLYISNALHPAFFFDIILLIANTFYLPNYCMKY